MRFREARVVVEWNELGDSLKHLIFFIPRFFICLLTQHHEQDSSISGSKDRDGVN